MNTIFDIAKAQISFEDERSLLDRLTKARWIAGKNIVSENWSKLTFTPLGQLNLLTIAVRLIPAAPKAFGLPARKVSWWKKLKAAVHFELLCKPLGKRITLNEKALIAAWAIVLEKKTHENPQTVSLAE